MTKTDSSRKKPTVIFFGNGPLADSAIKVLSPACDIIFHAHDKSDLETVKTIKSSHPEAFGILASFGVIIKSDLLALFEPVGILNLHPSLLPKYRGPSPIESAILNGDTKFGISIMKLAPAMDAGSIYHQETLNFPLSTPKDAIYHKLATAGASWLKENLSTLPAPVPQVEASATYTKKLDKSMSPLLPDKKTAQELANEIRAFSKFPKSIFKINNLECIIISAKVLDKKYAPSPKDYVVPIKPGQNSFCPPVKPTSLLLQCKDNSFLSIVSIQPVGRKIMDAKSFINGYLKTK